MKYLTTEQQIKYFADTFRELPDNFIEVVFMGHLAFRINLKLQILLNINNFTLFADADKRTAKAFFRGLREEDKTLLIDWMLLNA